MNPDLILSATALIITLCLCLTALHAWRGWLDLRRLQLSANAADRREDEIGTRIELASVRERLKRLEAIANGVDF